jgi:class 3 adenylate cyclase
VRDCLRAAAALEELTRGLGEANPKVEQSFGLAVGINRGIAAMGAGGDHSAIGDDVNLVFRLETAARDGCERTRV